MSKQDVGKYKPSLIYTSLLKEVSKVRQFGIEKYGGTEDWITTEVIRNIDAAIRHLRAFLAKENFDKESGLHHLSHAATDIMFEIERMYRKQLPELVKKNKTSSQMKNLGEYLTGGNK